MSIRIFDVVDVDAIFSAHYSSRRYRPEGDGAVALAFALLLVDPVADVDADGR